MRTFTRLRWRQRGLGEGSRRMCLWAAGLALVLAGAVGCASGSKQRKEDDSGAVGGEGSSEELPEPSEQPVASKSAPESGSSSQKKTKPVTGPAKKKLERAVQIMNEGNLRRSGKILKRLLDNSESGFLAAYNLGIIAEQLGQPKAAAKRYTQSLQKNPDFTPALLNLVRLYLRQGRVSDAEAIADNYANQRPQNLDHRVAKLEVLLAKKQYSTVIQKAKEILRRDERNVGAMVAMAKANYWMERHELAKAILNRASELNAERADIYFLYGLIAMDNDENQRAISNFKKALEKNPRFAEAHNNLGLMYQEAGDFGGAAAQFEAALEDYPSFKEAILNVGIAYKQLGEFGKAEAQFEQVIEMDSDYADAYFNLGVLYLDSKVPGMDKIPRLKEAIATLNKYKRVVKGQLGEDDPANQYIKSAREKIKVERQRQKMMRQAQQGASGSKSGENSSKDGEKKQNEGSSKK